MHVRTPLARHRPLGATSLAVAAVVTATTLGASAASATGHRAPSVRVVQVSRSTSALAQAASSAKPTIVLVHGAFADAGGFGAVSKS